MRKLLPVALGLSALLSACRPATTPEATPVWQDEFGGASLNAAHWTPMVGNGFLSGTEYVPGWGNNELQYYTGRPENVRVENGELVITARREAYAGTANGQAATFPWTSARLRTAGKFSRAYGRFEMRAKFPVGQGLWPAFWLLPEEPNPYGTWAASGEIDIAEGWGSRPNEVAHTIHYGGVWPNNVYSGVTTKLEKPVSEWHVYALEWTPGELRWFVDGKLTATKTNWWSARGTPPASDADLHAWPAPFDQPFHILLNLAVGGNFDGNPTDQTPGTAEMRVDYVRVYSLPGETRNPGPRPETRFPWTPVQGRPALPDGNLVYNGSFDWADNDPRVGADASTLPGVPQSSFWTLYQGDGEARLTNEGGALKVDVQKPGNVNYAVQVRQDGLNLVSGKRYEVSFNAWAATPRPVMVKVGGGPDRGYAAYSGERTLDLSAAPQRLKFSFDMKATTDAAARLEFNLGNAGAGPVWLDNAEVREVGDAAGARPPTADGNLLYNAGLTESAGHPGIPGTPGTAYWSVWNEASTGLSTSVEGGAINLDVSRLNPEHNWHVQLNQTEVGLTQGKTYRLSFMGRASSARTVGVVVGEQGGSYARYLDADAALGTEWQPLSYTFTAPTTNPAAQFQILGAVGTAGESYRLSFKDFRLTEVP